MRWSGFTRSIRFSGYKLKLKVILINYAISSKSITSQRRLVCVSGKYLIATMLDCGCFRSYGQFQIDIREYAKELAVSSDFVGTLKSVNCSCS